MNAKRGYVALCCTLMLMGCSVSRISAKNVLTAAELKPVGRTLLNADNKLELISSAAHFGVSFKGKECLIYASTGIDHNYLQYELDGIYQRRIRINRDNKQPILIEAGSSGKHIITIYKATEAHTGAIAIEKIEGSEIASVKPDKSPIIEFIGNSITCGAAADVSEVACGKGEYHDQHNAYMAYGPRVARKLKANYVLSSVSGIGVYRNWNSDSPTMPGVYENTDFQEGSSLKWNFDTFKPKIVSIALGTNDFSHGDGVKKRLPFDSTTFINTYLKFVSTVKSKYPKAKIALLTSPVFGPEDDVLIQKCLSSVKRKVDLAFPKDQPVALFFFKTIKARGCTGHPSVDDHELLAEQLEPFFRKLL